MEEKTLYSLNSKLFIKKKLVLNMPYLIYIKKITLYKTDDI